MIKKDLHIKDHFFNYFSKQNKMNVGRMYFRLYDPNEDVIIKRYNKEDWNHIFRNVTESELKELAECVNVIILIWCDSLTESPRGMLYLQESYPIPGKISFHGGTWDHNPVFFQDIFRSLLCMFQFLFQFCDIITTTCEINNRHADKFQKSFGFTETHRDHFISYKFLDIRKFQESVIVKSGRFNNING